MKNIFIYLSLIILAVSCTKEITIKEKELNKKLVAQSLFSPDSLWRVHLSETANRIKNEEIANVTNGTILIKDIDGNILAELTHTTEGIYKSVSHKPKIGEQYMIEVSSPDHPILITASSYIPKPVEFTVDTFSIFRDRSEKVELTFTIDDDADVTNFYIIRVYEIYDYNYGDVSGNNLWLTSNDVNIENIKNNEFEQGFDGNLIFLRDDSFNGKSYKLKCEIYKHNLYSTYNSHVYEDPNNMSRTLLMVTNCTEDAFNYLLSIELSRDTYDDPLLTPMNLHSNFSSDIGIFAGYYDNSILVAKEE